MFLSTDNRIKWKLLGWGAIVTAFLTLLGIVWFDEPLLLFMRNFDWKIWHLFDRVFDAKMWLIVSVIIAGVFYLKKVMISGVKYKSVRHKFSLNVFLYDVLQKVRTSHAFFIFCSVLTTSILIKVLKIVIGRARPIFYEALNMTGFFPINTEWAFNSMPSGHTAASFAGLVMAGMLVPKMKPFTWTLAIVVGVSRVCIGAHWPSDVILGAFIGMVMADFVKAYLRHRIATSPKNNFD